MPEFKEQLKAYLHKDNKTSEDCTALLNENPEALLEEQELENLIELSFNPVDVKKSVLDDLKESAQKPVSDFALNIVEEIKEQEAKKPEPIQFAILAIAASLVLGLVFFGVPQSFEPKISFKDPQENHQLSSHKETPQIKNNLQILSPEKNVKELVDIGDSVQGEGRLALPEDVNVASYDQAEYTFESTPKSFLKMTRGKALIDVKSRKGKTPLYFNLPHGQVEVTGTQFELLATPHMSSVKVTEGTVNYIAKDKTVQVTEGQTGSSSSQFIKAGYNLADTILHYHFDSPDSLLNTNNLDLVYGASGNSLQMNGQTYIVLSPLALSSKRSLSFWVNTDELVDQEKTILSLTEGGNILHFYMRGEEIHMESKVPKAKVRKTNFRVRYGWHHICLIQDQNKYRLYLNGTNLKNGTLPSFETPHLSIGSNQNSFAGKLDELRVINRLLSSDEVLILKEERNFSYSIK
ncbi:MAG: FecR domain-containing protein [Lentisphaerales bacterium]|nr:FecR domain-containing protein [Lentisphaerales bacterium]